MHFLLILFENHLTTESDEYRERFYQTCLWIIEQFKGKNVHALIADLCWTIIENNIEFPRCQKRNRLILIARYNFISELKLNFLYILLSPGLPLFGFAHAPPEVWAWDLSTILQAFRSWIMSSLRPILC